MSLLQSPRVLISLALGGVLLLSIALALVQAQRPLVTESEVAQGIARLALVERQEVVVGASDWASCDEDGRHLFGEVSSHLRARRAGEDSPPLRSLTPDEQHWFERCRGLLMDVHAAAAAGHWMAEVAVSPGIVVVLVFLSGQLPVEQRLGLLLDAAGPAFYFWPMLWDLWAVLVLESDVPMPALEERLARLADSWVDDSTLLESTQMFRELSHELPLFHEVCGGETLHPDQWLALMMEGLESPASRPNALQHYLGKHLGGRFRRHCVAHMADDTVAYVRRAQRDARTLRPLALQDAHALLRLRRSSCARQEFSAELRGARTNYLLERRSAAATMVRRAIDLGSSFGWRRSLAGCLPEDGTHAAGEFLDANEHRTALGSGRRRAW